MTRLTIALCLSASFIALPAFAQVTLLSGDHGIDGQLCVGGDCTAGDMLGDAELTIKDVRPYLLFDDTSSSLANKDWAFEANQNSTERFSLIDLDTNNRIIGVEGAPQHSLFIQATGEIGLGTTLPGEDLHIVAATAPQVRFEQVTGTPQTWDIGGNEVGFFIDDETASTFPFLIRTGAPSQAFAINTNGDIGLGTSAPTAPLEVQTEDSFSFFRLSAAGAEINTSVDFVFTGGPLGTGQLRYNIVDGDNQEMTLDADGNMVLDGTLTTAGPTCSGGCDRVFDADYDLMSIHDYAATMYDKRHLPQVGPTQPGAPVNVTETMGNMLNALEHAHIYIHQLHSTVEAERSRADRLEAQMTGLIARLDKLEAD